MLKNRSILVVVPARGGSKGVPLKNIRSLLGRPLLAYTGDVVREVDWIDRAVVSTDDPRIADAAKECGLDAPFFRPESLSGDRIGDYDVLLHALLEMERLDGRTYDVVAMLQPTCPLRTAEHVRGTVAKLVEEDWDAVWTVSETDLKFHPLKQLVVDETGAMNLYDPKGKSIIARQQLTPVYYRNGAAYAFSRRSLVEEKTIMPKRTASYVVAESLVNIDTVDDFDRAEAALAARLNRKGGA